MRASFKLVGADAVRQRLERLASLAPDAIGRAMRQEIEIEATEAKLRTPVDTGTLRGTVHAFGPERRWRTIQVGIAAGGPAAPYALYVHEDLEAFHKVGQAKYIESVLNEAAPHLPARILRRVESELKR